MRRRSTPVLSTPNCRAIALTDKPWRSKSRIRRVSQVDHCVFPPAPSFGDTVHRPTVQVTVSRHEIDKSFNWYEPESYRATYSGAWQQLNWAKKPPARSRHTSSHVLLCGPTQSLALVT